MLPKLRQRLIITTAVVIGATCWLLICELLQSQDQSSGLSLSNARVGFLTALGLIVLSGLPVLTLGSIASAAANPLAGIFAVCAALTTLAAAGGDIDGYLDRTNLPQSYGWLVLESLTWLGGVIGLLYLIQRVRSPLRQYLPSIASDDHYGIHTRITIPNPTSLLAGVVATAVAAMLSYALLQTTDTKQVIGSLILAFAIGGMIGQVLVPQDNPSMILAGPLLLAAGIYTYVWQSYSSDDAIRQALFSNKLLPLALALPIHYASAAIVGSTLGIGLAQGFDQAKADVN